MKTKWALKNGRLELVPDKEGTAVDEWKVSLMLLGLSDAEVSSMLEECKDLIICSGGLKSLQSCLDELLARASMGYRPKCV